MTPEQLTEIKERCDKAIKELTSILPEQVDYAELVGAEGFARGFHYVWDSPEPYIIDNAAKLINELSALLTEIERLKANYKAIRNELCLKCGKYREAHNGACDGCRWESKNG